MGIGGGGYKGNRRGDRGGGLQGNRGRAAYAGIGEWGFNAAAAAAARAEVTRAAVAAAAAAAAVFLLTPLSFLSKDYEKGEPYHAKLPISHRQFPRRAKMETSIT